MLVLNTESTNCAVVHMPSFIRYASGHESQKVRKFSAISANLKGVLSAISICSRFLLP